MMTTGRAMRGPFASCTATGGMPGRHPVPSIVKTV